MSYIKTHRWARILRGIICAILGLIVLVVVFAVAFINLWPAFGGKVSDEDKLEYAARAENYSNGKFYNEVEMSLMTDTVDMYADRASKKGITPKDELPTYVPKLLDSPTNDDLTITWLGHSTSIIQMQGMNIMIDPVLGDVASPVSFTGCFRYGTIPMTMDEIPHIDIMILSHDHYDHLDYKSIKAVDDRVDRYIVPLGVENHLERWGVSEDKITTVAWWDEIDINGLTIGCAPSRHFSGRKIIDSNATLWASWVLINDKYKVYESGDSGFGDQFAKIHDKYGDFDLVMLDCAQYNTAWHDVHMFPEESVDAAKILGAKTAMPIHWGAFVLSDHAWDDPVNRYIMHAEEIGLDTITPHLGETVLFGDNEKYKTKWWKEIE